MSSLYNYLHDPNFYEPGHIASPVFLAKLLWCVVGGFVALLTLLNVLSFLAARYRSSHAQNDFLIQAIIDPCQHLGNFVSALFSLTLPWGLPSLGSILSIMIYIGTVMGIYFGSPIAFDVLNYELLGLRASWLTIAQLPLVIALSNRQVLLPTLIGISSEKLNVLHRAVALLILVTASLHASWEIRFLGPKSVFDFMKDTNSYIREGLAAYSLLAWIVVSAVLPIRQFSHNLFVLNHILSICGFFVAVSLHMHIAHEAYVFIMPALGLYASNRLFIFARSLFNGSRRQSRTALLTAAEGSRTTQIRIQDPPFWWSPGQHAYLKFPALRILEAHPFSIYSAPSDHALLFNVAERKGLTARLRTKALTEGSEAHVETSMSVIVDGPYGYPSRLTQFDTALFFGAGTGLSHCVPLAVNYATYFNKRTAGPRRVTFVAIVKSVQDLMPYLQQLVVLLEAGNQPDHLLKVNVEAYITRASTPGQDQDLAAIKQSGLAVHFQRPLVKSLLDSKLLGASGLTALSVCGPQSFSRDVVNTAAWHSLSGRSVAIYDQTYGF